MPEQRVAIMKTREGFTVHSFDFTDNIYQVFKGPDSLKYAIEFCTSNGYHIVNFKHFRTYKSKGGPLLEEKQK
jgi:hypothetical protein